GVDGTRYLLLSFGNFGEDMDVNWEKFTEKFNADLANGLGNLVSRVIKLSENIDTQESEKFAYRQEFINWINSMETGKALDHIWIIIRDSNKYIEDNKPWELAKNNPEKFQKTMQKLIADLYLILHLLIPFLPETSEKIKTALETKKTEILFQRIK
ncbi:MAG: class I tRNA ligase family protein, partial [Candidatus Moranbacteria bacterium]|nr:class I tRNA ligase family protein [Candidatus Moranbacteria bacterium]